LANHFAFILLPTMLLVAVPLFAILFIYFLFAWS